MPGFLQSVFGTGVSTDDNTDDANKQTQNQNTDQANIDPNKQNNVDSNKSIWDNNTQDPDNENNQQTQKVEITQKPVEKTPTEKMQEHISGLNLTDGIDSNQIMEDMREGKIESFDAAMQTVSGNAYQAAMTDMNSIMDAKIAKITDDVTADANASMNSNLAIQQMEQKLEFTKDKDISPIAKAALAQSIKNGADIETAIGQVEAFFAKAAGSITKSMKPPLNSSGNPQFPEDENNNRGQTEHDEWLDVLTGKT